MAFVTGNACLQLDTRERPAAPDTLVPPGGGDLGGVTTAAGRMPEPEVGYYIAPGTGGHGRARTDGLLAVIQAFACRVGVFGYDATRHDKFLIMVAARPVLDALDLLLPSVAMQMEAAARTAARAYGEEIRSALPDLPDARKRSVLKVPYFRNYLRGFGQGAAETIQEIRAEFIQAEGDALPRILAEQDVRAEEVYSREFPDTSGLRHEQAGHTDGFLEGQDAGQSVDLGDEYLAQHDLVFAMI
ncbi:MAG TPA: hypothetical protein VN969_07540 [Streptosporangiaceae bacterium]|nr:hypothetical protein [Streptosporangiaceae bacterium]